MLELFSGTGRMAQAFKDLSYKTVTVDTTFTADYQEDVLAITKERIIEICGGNPDVIWMGTPCTGFSVASIGTHWAGGKGAYIPKTETAKKGIALAAKCAEIVSWFPKATFAIENPRGLLRKLPILAHFPRRTITFCAFGERRMKPTDIWTNAYFWVTPQPCKNGMPCHEAAPRGSRTGTQGLKNAYDRAAYPLQFCKSFSEACNNHNGVL